MPPEHVVLRPEQAAILGIVQGLTEFLPVSSSAHLILVPWLFGWGEPGLTFDVGLHMGTLLALIVYFWRDWLRLGRAGLLSVVERRIGDDPDRRLAWYIVLASVPAALIGAVFADTIEQALRSPTLIAFPLMALGLVLLWVEQTAKKVKTLDDYTLTAALVVGCSQAIALLPGISRSGITMTTSLWLGFTREAAARFSFLMSMPITLGAGIFQFRHLARNGLPPDERLAFAVGIAAAAISGGLAIAVLLQYVRRQSFAVFAYYRLALGIVVLVVVALGR
ncbi:MAG: undecaprenyl-diphosphatase UppP [Chloroflexi bacterium]|nr:undecaprenyl-diphosphatase UppP [Chloroflexota bacterium]